MPDLQERDYAIFFRAQNQLCALPLEDVAETMRLQPVRQAAGLPAFILGISLIRGAIVPVIDVAIMLGAARTQSVARLIVLRVGARTVGLAVEAVLGVRALPQGILQELPPLLRDAGSAIATIGSLDHELLTVLQSSRLLTGPHMEGFDAGDA